MDPLCRAATAADALLVDAPLLSSSRGSIQWTAKAHATFKQRIKEITRRNRLALEAERDAKKFEEDRAALDAVERDKLYSRLIAAGGDTPGTAWEDADKRIPCKRLAEEPLESLRARVIALEALPRRAGLVPPARSTAVSSAETVVKTMTVNGKTIELTARDLRICEESKCKVEDYAALKLQRDSGRSGK